MNRLNLIIIILVALFQISNAQNNDAFYFITDRNTAKDNQYEVFKARINQSGLSVVLVKGQFVFPERPEIKKAQIAVYNAATGELTGIYNTNQRTGNYLVLLVPNVKYEFVIQIKGYAPIKKIVEVPKYAGTKITDELSSQKITITQTNGVIDASIENLFNEETEPVLFLLTIYNENSKQPYLKELYDTDEEEFMEFIESDRRQLKETSYDNVDELLKKETQEQAKKPKIAKNYFDKKDYKNAAEIYEELIKLYPDNAEYNYNYAVCLYETGKPVKAISYFKKARINKCSETMLPYYLGRCYHLWSNFEPAVDEYNKAQKTLSPQTVKQLNIPKLIAQCQSGKQLMNRQLNIDLISKKDIDVDKLSKSYPAALAKDVIVEKTEFFISPADKKSNEKLWMCRQGAVVIQPSYGIKDTKQKDLYFNTLIGNDKWSLSQPMPDYINSPFDENYVYLTPDGLTLYFASKGFNSIGGYDLFKCTRASTKDAFSKPENLGYPINSPYDDILFIPDSTGEIGYFCTNRRMPSPNKWQLYKIKIPKKPLDIAIIKGHFMTNDSIPQTSATITVINTNNDEIAGIYNTNATTGKYLMALIPGIKYELIVETDNYKEHTAYMTIPVLTEKFPLKQHLRLKKEGAFEILNIDNYFTREEAENTTTDFDLSKYIVKNTSPKTSVKKDKTIKSDRKPDTQQATQLKTAVDLVKKEKFTDALKIFNRLYPLVDFSPTEAYYYALSLENNSPDWYTITKLYELAGTSSQTPKDVYLKLAIANMNTYRFERALKAIERYQLVMRGKNTDQQLLAQIKTTCEMGKKMSQKPKAMEILKIRKLKPQYLNTAFNSINIQGKFLAAPEELITPEDKKRNHQPILFLNKQRNVMYFSSYGTDGKFGKDLYIRRKLPDNTWSPPINLGYTLNTKKDEDYPFLSNDGKTLYFASQGHNSIGGYDIFKCTWNEKTDTWNPPVNIGLPINSTFNDFFYVEQ